MARPRSPLFVLFLTVFIDLIGFGIVIPILPLYAEQFHASPDNWALGRSHSAIGSSRRTWTVASGRA